MMCKGINCTATNGAGHSVECFAEHEKTISSGVFDTPGNRNPDARYRGYKGESLSNGATSDEMLAWEEGKNARA